MGLRAAKILGTEQCPGGLHFPIIFPEHTSPVFLLLWWQPWSGELHFSVILIPYWLSESGSFFRASQLSQNWLFKGRRSVPSGTNKAWFPEMCRGKLEAGWLAAAAPPDPRGTDEQLWVSHTGVFPRHSPRDGVIWLQANSEIFAQWTSTVPWCH